MELYLATNQLDKIEKMLNDSNARFISNSDLIEYYFKTGKPKEYIKSTLLIGVRNIDSKASLLH